MILLSSYCHIKLHFCTFCSGKFERFYIELDIIPFVYFYFQRFAPHVLELHGKHHKLSMVVRNLHFNHCSCSFTPLLITVCDAGSEKETRRNFGSNMAGCGETLIGTREGTRRLPTPWLQCSSHVWLNWTEWPNGNQGQLTFELAVNSRCAGASSLWARHGQE